MRETKMRRIRNERGVAMVTVLLVGSALTAVTSVAAFATIREFRAGRDDRKAAEALSYAEAGIDRFIAYLKSGLVTFGQLNEAGCARPAISLPPGTVGSGSFSAKLTVYDPFATIAANRFPIAPASGACANRPTSPHPGQNPSLEPDKTFFVIESTGTHPDAKRTIRQVIAVEPVGLPVGVYAHAFDPKAHPNYANVSVVSETTFNDRERDSFSGNDSYYLMKDFFPGGVTGRSPDEPVPAAAHAVGGIFLKNSSQPEFTGPPNGTKNCTANEVRVANPGSVASQSLWDSDGSPGSGTITSGCSGQTGFPNSSRFTQEQLENFARPRLSQEDHETLKEAARLYGVYCSFQGAGGTGGDSCTRQGSPTGADYQTYIQNVHLGTGGALQRNSFIFYIEYRSGTPAENNISTFGSVWGCDSANPDNTKSIVAIVRNGGMNFTGGAGLQVNGALLMDGNFRVTGGFRLNGSLISLGTVEWGSSSQTAQLDACWVKNMPGPFMRFVPRQWSEIDR